MRIPHPHQFDGQDWGRWPQQQAADYPMMATPPLMPFDSPATSHGNETKQILTQPLGPPYMMPNQYQPAPSYDGPPRAAPYDQPMPFNYGQYSTPSPTTPLTPPFKPQIQHRPDMRLLSPVEAHAYVQPRGRSAQYHELSSSPMIKTDSYPDHPAASSPEMFEGPQKEVNPILPDDPLKHVEFNTPIDNLMRKYQRFGGSQKASSPTQLPTPAQSPRTLVNRRLPQRHRKPKGKLFGCLKCDYASTQKAHLTAHERTHTSVLPFACHICGKKCSQKGNLDVHIRAHKGERVFKCDHPGCDSAGFFSKSNLVAHQKIHSEGRAKWICKIGDCTKSFSSIGNRKAHQNKFHDTEFARLALLIEEYNKTGMCPAEDKSLVEELATIYKNSNKGIKGRGKGVKVEKIRQGPLVNMPYGYLGCTPKGNPMMGDRPAIVGSVSQMLAPPYARPDHNGPMDMMYRPGRDF